MVIVVGVGKADEEAPNNIEETVGRVISASAASSPPPNSYWEEVRKVVNRAVTCLFPPKIDFRPGKPVEDGQVNGNENMKESITKSFHTTKQMVEDSAKAAAQTLRPQPDSEL
ncbi:uncharacterized protein LOC111452199 [Cucurbita moschata]|uniref:Uncharacterized protein LOC111452199 n=1 Tax=Cucurbita moschata TaxID=3662 RepID=A0A6J1G9K3_CUCMO|nr:uncharacterized protein LOC111452199 [Cucurbita moschata]